MKVLNRKLDIHIFTIYEVGDRTLDLEFDKTSIELCYINLRYLIYR